MDDILALVKERTETLPAGTWIKGSRYAEYFLAENRHPTRLDLDQVSPQHPVVIYHTSFHACTLNSRALELANIDRNTPDPQGGKIEKDASTGEQYPLEAIYRDSKVGEIYEGANEVQRMVIARSIFGRNIVG